MKKLSWMINRIEAHLQLVVLLVIITICGSLTGWLFWATNGWTAKLNTSLTLGRRNATSRALGIEANATNACRTIDWTESLSVGQNNRQANSQVVNVFVPELQSDEQNRSDDCIFDLFKQVEEVLRGQMNLWLTVLTILGMLLGMVVPLASYMLQRRTLDDERKRIDDELTETKETARRAIDSVGGEIRRSLSTKLQEEMQEHLEEMRQQLEQMVKTAQEQMNSKIESVSKKTNDSSKSEQSSQVTGDTFAKQKKEFESVRAKAENGEGVYQLRLGYLYEFGRGVPMNWQKAVEWYEKAANQGLPEAQFNLGNMYSEGKGCKKDSEKAVKYWADAAGRGEPDAQFNLGWAYNRGEGCEKNEVKAVEWWTRAAAKGQAEAQSSLGYAYATGKGCKVDTAKAIELWTKAADRGSAVAQSNLGELYRYGIGCEKDLGKAIRLFRDAVKKDSPVALNNLAEMLEIGDGIPADKQEAVSLYRRSVDQNNGGGWRNLGRLYESGLCGFVKNLKEAEKCYRKAIEDTSTTVWVEDEKKLVPVAKVAQEDLKRVRVKMQQEC